MIEMTLATWNEINQGYLVASLATVRAALQRHVAQGNQRLGEQPDNAPPTPWPPPYHQVSNAQPPALETLCATFGLSPFERDLLLLCAGMELEADFAVLCAAAQPEPQRAYPTFSLALAALPAAHWSALSPAAPLRHWRLIEVGAGSTLATSPLRIDERILHYLAGVHHLDERLVGFVQPLPIVETSSSDDPAQWVPSHRALAEQIAAAWTQAAGRTVLPVVQLCGAEPAAKWAIAAAACRLLGLHLHLMPAHVLPPGPSDLDVLMRLWEREAALGAGALLLDGEDVERSDTTRENLITRFIEGAGGALILTGRERRRAHHRPLITYDVYKPTSGEQRVLWHTNLGSSEISGGTLAGLNGQLDHLAAQFDLGISAIQAACTQALTKVREPEQGSHTLSSSDPIISHLWNACRLQARPRLDDLAQRIEPAAAWDDLVLPSAQRQTLREVDLHVRQRARVYEAWGFAAKSARGLGISALFAGPSGTGKTMAAEVLAYELRLDLYRIDLSQVVSKYIGETEKNLRRVFDAAEEGGAILLFDEADALFGKRSEVKDSHDRYANIEVSYLLQRMEAYRGLAILTTNMKSALDDAFLRRIRFTVQFPFPDAFLRAEIWRRIFPAETPTEGLEAQVLGQLNVAGGNIRNIALNAAFLAAEAGQPVRMAHLLQAARGEYVKLGKSLTEVETRGW